MQSSKIHRENLTRWRALRHAEKGQSRHTKEATSAIREVVMDSIWEQGATELESETLAIVAAETSRQQDASKESTGAMFLAT